MSIDKTPALFLYVGEGLELYSVCRPVGLSYKQREASSNED